MLFHFGIILLLCDKAEERPKQLIMSFNLSQ